MTDLKPDLRTLQERLADLRDLGTYLSGNYEVVDTRQDRVVATQITVNLKDDGFLVFIKGEKGVLFFSGSGCSASLKPFRSLYCRRTQSGISSINMEHATHRRIVESGTLIGGFKPMEVKVNDFLFEYHEQPAGRSHYYLLRKK